MTKSNKNNKGSKKPSPTTKSAKKKSRSTSQMRSIPRWFSSVADPWSSDPSPIPDEQTQQSVKYVSRAQGSIDCNYNNNNQQTLLIGLAPWMSVPSTGSGPFTGTFLSYMRANTTAGSDFQLEQGTKPGRITNTWINQSAMTPGVTTTSSSSQTSYTYRCTAMSLKLSSNNPELYRDGTFVAGLAAPSVNYASNAVVSQYTDPLTSVYNINTGSGAVTLSMDNVVGRLRRLAQQRLPDGSIQLNWIPSGVPQYKPLLTDGLPLGTVFGPDPDNVLIFAYKGPLANSTSLESFRFQIIAHWEVVPISLYSLVVSPTPSPYDPTALAYCLNRFQQLRSIYEEADGMTLALSDGAQVAGGSAWETVRSGTSNVLSLAQSAFTGGNKVATDLYGALNTPLGRLALGTAMNAGRRRAMQHRLEL